MSIPIVFIHQNDSPYLPFSLVQSKELNSKSSIFLIGDNSNNYYKFVEHDNITNYFNQALQFAKIYKHMSPNKLSFELFCFQRWFILKDFMVKNNIQKCVYLDSDVMVYTNLTEEQKKFSHFDFTISSKVGNPNCSFINNIEALENYCNFLIKLYTDSELFKLLKLQLEEKSLKGLKEGISDMTGFEEYFKTKLNNLGTLQHVIDDSTYDRNIRRSHGFEMDDNLKKIYWINNQPFCKQLDSDKLIKFNTLHFQGSAKQYMKNHFKGDLTRLYYFMFQNKARRKLQKINVHISDFRSKLSSIF